MDGFRVRYSYSLLRSSNVLASLVAVPGTAEEGAMDFLKLTGAPSDFIVVRFQDGADEGLHGARNS